MQKITVALLLALLVVSAYADSPAHWIEVKSLNFVVLTNGTERDARHIAGQFERMRTVFHTLLPAATDDADSPIIVVALKDKKSFQALEPSSYLAKNSLDLAGLFMNAPDKNYVLVRLDASGEDRYATVYHEYTHYMLRKAEEWIPIWLNEGLAEFYQNTEIEEKTATLGKPSFDDIAYLQQNRLLPLPTLLLVDHNSPYYHEEQKGSVFYAESWALTHYLMVTDFQQKAHRIQDYTRLLAHGIDPITAAQQSFGDLKQLQHALEGYIQQQSYSQFRLNSGASVTETAFTTRVVPLPEANATRADVLVYTDRSKEARALLDTTLAEAPDSASAHESMGFLTFRDGDTAAARKWYAEAVQLGSHSYLAHYYFAALTLQTNAEAQDSAVESSLRTSIQLNPNFAPSYDALANFYAMRHEKLDEAHSLNVKAVTLEPTNLDYRFNAAAVLMENQQPASALSVLKAAMKLAKTANDRQRVQNRINEIQSYKASVEAARYLNAQSASVTTTSVAAGEPIVIREPDSSSTPGFPDAAPGPHHTSSGVIRSVHCSYPTILTLNLDPTSKSGKPVALYSNNYFKISFIAANYNPDKDIAPCSNIEGMKAKIEYAETSDKSSPGQIISIELSK